MAAQAAEQEEGCQPGSLAEVLMKVQTIATAEESAQTLYNDEFVVTAVHQAMAHPLRQMVGNGVGFLIVSAPSASDRERLQPAANEVAVDAAAADEEGSPEPPIVTATKAPHLVLKADDARHALSTYMLATLMMADPWPVLAPCSAGGSEPAAVLGVQRDGRGVVSYRLPLMADKPAPKSGAPELKQLVQRFQNSAATAIAEPRPRQHASAVYDIVGASDEQTLTSVAVHFEWADPPAVFGAPPYSATSLMRARVLSGDSKSPASWLHNDGLLLDGLVARIGGGDAIGGEPAEWRDTEGAVRGLVDDFLSNLVTEGGRPVTTVTVGATTESNAGKIARRSDLDFTERLWELCKGAVSFDDLRGSLAQVFRALQTGQVQPMVHKTNTTAIATVARQCLLRATDPAAADELRSALQRLSDPRALIEAVAEIGLAKLRRDYVAYFVGEELSTGQQLDYFVSDAVPFAERVDRLHRLHAVLELVVTVKAYCDIPHASLRQLFMNSLQHYRKEEITAHAPTFELRFPSFSESASKVKRLCARMDPTRWTLEMRDEARPHDRATTIFSTTLESFGVIVSEEGDPFEYAPLDDNVADTAYYSTYCETRHTVV